MNRYTPLYINDDVEEDILAEFQRMHTEITPCNNMGVDLQLAKMWYALDADDLDVSKWPVNSYGIPCPPVNKDRYVELVMVLA